VHGIHIRREEVNRPTWHEVLHSGVRLQFGQRIPRCPNTPVLLITCAAGGRKGKGLYARVRKRSPLPPAVSLQCFLPAKVNIVLTAYELSLAHMKVSPEGKSDTFMLVLGLSSPWKSFRLYCVNNCNY